jgi:2-iminobutanoate/2-iminopropanoate deaminase
MRRSIALAAAAAALASCGAVGGHSPHDSRTEPMTETKTVTTADAPKAIGPYSQAVVRGGLVFCSGQIALDPASGALVGADAAAQADRALKNLMAVLAAAGSGPEHALRCTLYLVRMEDFAAVNEVYARYFPAASPPARSTVAVAVLPKGAWVEIDCIAALATAKKP